MLERGLRVCGHVELNWGVGNSLFCHKLYLSSSPGLLPSPSRLCVCKDNHEVHGLFMANLDTGCNEDLGQGMG